MNYLQMYQQQLGLTADGILGPKSAALMMSDLGVTDKLLFAHVIAQAQHESGNFTHFRENMNYNAAGLLNIFRKYYTNELAAAHSRKPEKIANHVYANRMGNGNESSGDGWRYRGWGSLQLTGRANITRFFRSIGLPEDTDPDSLKDDPKSYFQGAFFWFKDNNANALCTGTSASCVLNVSRKVNLGNTMTSVTPNGLSERTEYSKKLFHALGLA